MTILLVRRGTAFDPRYVETLAGQIGRFHPGEPIVTLTDRPDTPGRTAPLRTDLPGWWAKMELFAPWNADLRPALFVDLDTFVLGPIDDLLGPSARLGMLRAFRRRPTPASGIMSVPRDTAAIWDAFMADPQAEMARHHGDQDFLAPHCGWFLQDRHEGIVSYRRYCPAARLVCFHGAAKPHREETRQSHPWVAEHWPAR